MKDYAYKLITKWFLVGCSNYNPLSVRKKCRSKNQAKQIFKLLNIPSAPSLLFYNPFKVFNFVKKYGYPVVIKPNIGGFSRGAHFPIINYWQLLKASFFVKIWWPSSIIEGYISGGNYRIVAIEGKIMSILKRYPPFVVGDGKNDISTLIDKENQLRRDMKLLPAISAIKKNKAIKQYIKQNKLSLTSIPAKNKKVYLHNKISLNTGGVVEIIDNTKLSSTNKDIIFAILAKLSANILGVDVICETIEIDFNKQKCIFLELNSRPFLAMHNYPRYGKKQDLSEYYQILNSKKIANENTY